MSRTRLARNFLALILSATALHCRAIAAPLEIVDGTSHLLETVAQSTNRTWDSVVVAPDGRIFVQYPRLLGDPGPSLAVLQNGTWVPYPGGSWNAAATASNLAHTDDPATSFISLNGLTLGADGSLWALDNAIPGPGKPPLAGAAKLVRIDLASNNVAKTYSLGPDIVFADSILSSVRVRWPYAFIADAGRAGLILLDLRDGHARRFLDNAPSLTARRPISIDNVVLRDATGHAAAMNVSMLEISPDGRWLYYQPPCGPLYRLGTDQVTDPAITAVERDDSVTLWYNTPALGGMTIAPDGTLYFTDIATHSIISFSEGRIPRRILNDPRLRWPGNPFITPSGQLYVPVTQIDHTALFRHGHPDIQWPLMLYRIDTTAIPAR